MKHDTQYRPWVRYTRNACICGLVGCTCVVAADLLRPLEQDQEDQLDVVGTLVVLQNPKSATSTAVDGIVGRTPGTVLTMDAAGLSFTTGVAGA